MLITSFKKIITGLIDRLTKRNAGQMLDTAARPVATKKARVGRPLVHHKDRPATPKERVYASRAKQRRQACFETHLKSCFETSNQCFETAPLKKEKKREDDEDAREAILKLANDQITERIAENVERIVREVGNKQSASWNRSKTRSEIARLLFFGVAQQVIIDTVREVAPRAKRQIKAFRYFLEEIEAAHHEVTAQGSLPLGPVGEIPVRKNNRILRCNSAVPIDWDSHVKEYRTNGKWLQVLGPPPDYAGCRAPPDVLRLYSFLPAASA
jgi:hypothetical protein